MQDRNQIGQFEALISPHLDAASNLPRWLVRNDQDAEDMVQEACLHALKFFNGFRGAASRPGCSRLCGIPVTPGYANTAHTS